VRLGAWWDRVRGAESRRLRARIAELRADNAHLRREVQRLEPKTVYSALEPDDANALTLFAGSWSSRLPGRDGPGHAELFTDPRIEWLAERVGSLEGLEILELGPLEAGHTFMLERRGATVTAIEGNQDSFVRSLIVKNLFGLRARFVLGDFARTFGPNRRWDMVVASGVLYHMSDPVSLVRRIAEVTDRIFLWTHYFEPDLSKWHPETAERIGSKWVVDETMVDRSAGCEVRMVPMLYQEAMGWSGFCGGPESFARWIYKDDILALLRQLGFADLTVAFDETGHINGPSFAVFATR
jgi:hypothetical protein